MKKSKKVGLSIVGIIVIVAIIGSVYWFSMPSEQRNMVLFMMGSGDNYDSYEEYQVIDRNDEGLVPTSFESTVADGSTEDHNINIVGITEMVENEDSKMLKKGMVQATGIDDYTGWHVIADEGASDNGYPFGPSPLSYYTSGLAANLHT